VLSKADNEMMCRIGLGTAMGNAMRRYWIPALTSEELPHPDCDPKRIMLLGEEFVAFRNTNGQVGFLDEYCCHRSASLALGRVEGNGIRCIYHGWKFAADGTVLDTPNVEDPKFKERFKARAFPVREAGGLIWVYLGPKEKEPPFLDWHWFHLPVSNRLVVTYVADCNYVQVQEALLDSSHLTILHTDGMTQSATDDLTFAKQVVTMQFNAAPRIEAEDTQFGVHYAAMRPNPAGDGKTMARIASFICPFATLNPNGDIVGIVVPINDVRSRHFFVFWNKDKKIGEEPLRSEQLRFVGMDPETLDSFGISLKECDRPGKPSRANNFLQDRQAMRDGRRFSGLPLFIPEDVAVEVASGPIRDRSKETLAPADGAIARMYRVLLASARRVADGGDPIGLNFDTSKVVGVSGLIEPGQPWQSLVPGHVAATRGQAAA
jgi:phenylpropionate dioxygenase-like ring-hydroxylating dioxygenase large terminal subunit